MRRGSTLTELAVAMGVLAVIMLVATRLLFASDRAMGAEVLKATQVGGAAELLADAGRDVRQATNLRAQAGKLIVGRARYVSDEAGTVRSERGRETDRYPGVSASFSTQGRLVIVAVKTDNAQMGTSFYRRN